MTNQLFDFEGACVKAYEKFKTEMAEYGWHTETQDSSNVNLTRHDRGKHKGLYSLTWKEFWRQEN